MVYFECVKCNESLKKPKVAKHLLVCGSDSVTCIDCLKVFYWDEFEAHTSCISEAQKYQGNLFVAKESSNKGQVKQDAWVDNVQRKIEDPSAGMRPEVKSQLQKLLGFSNIPRKQKPFANFVKNSLKIWNDKLIGEIWEVISGANAAPAKNPAPAPDASTAAGGDKPAAAKVEERSTPADTKKPASREEPAEDKEAAMKGGDSFVWTKALDAELLLAPDCQLPWKRLRDLLVDRYHEAGFNGDTTDGSPGWSALASIPEDYLSKEDNIVRLPSKKKRRVQAKDA